MEKIFKGLRTDKEEWIEGSLVIEFDGACFIEYWISECVEQETNSWEPVKIRHEVIPETIGQFTGKTIQTSPNVTRVFVGDKVLVRGTKSVGLYYTKVVESIFGFTLKDNKTYLNDDKCLMDVKAVIGR